MELEKRYIEEVGEAVEALGIMLERELGLINQRMEVLYRWLAESKEEEKDFGERIQEIKEEMVKNQKLLQGLENKLSRTVSGLSDLPKDIPLEEEFTEEIKNDLVAIKRELQFARSDLKELLEKQEDLEKSIKEHSKKGEGLGSRGL
jgi:chromosome segregation ATPase